MAGVEVPDQTPIGLQLARTAKMVTRAFEDALAAQGGSVPVWLILLALLKKPLPHAELAARVGIRGPTLTHHLDRMAEEGLVARQRDPQNRRVQWTELTDAGRAFFHRLRGAARAHDERLRSMMSAADERAFRAVLARLGEAFEEYGAPSP